MLHSIPVWRRDGLRGLAATLTVDFHAALGLGDVPPLSPFEFHVEVETDASDEDVQLVKKLADGRCPAIWAMQNHVSYATTARKV